MTYPAFTGSEPCTELGVEWFYPERSAKVARVAVACCARCDVRDVCLAWGVAHETDGVWGGSTPKGRERIRRGLGVIVERILP